MNTLINKQAFKAFIRQIVKEVVKEELSRRGGNTWVPKMFNRKSAAKYLGVSGSYIDNLVKNGQLTPAFPGEGKTKFYLREDLDAYAERGKDYLKKVIL